MSAPSPSFRMRECTALLRSRTDAVDEVRQEQRDAERREQEAPPDVDRVVVFCGQAGVGQASTVSRVAEVELLHQLLPLRHSMLEPCGP
eukprot:9486306-Pyramimonas_sp.AAC.1